MRQVIYAWNYREWGGVQIYFLSLIKEVKKKYDVIAVLPENSDKRVVDSLESLGTKLVYSPAVLPFTHASGLIERVRRRIRTTSSELRFIKVLLNQIRDADTLVQVDLGFWQSTFSLLRLSRKAHVFFTIHTALGKQRLFRELMWKWKGLMVSRPKTLHFLASNEDALRSLADYVRGRLFEETVVTYAGFDPDEIRAVSEEFAGREAVLREHRLPDRPLVVTVGQFIDRKGCWVVAASLKMLLEKGYDFTFVWLSTTPPDADQLSTIDRLGLGDHFRIISSDDIGGSRDELLSIVRSADVFVLASLQEGLPIALIEAMALGRACLTTNVNAIPEAIEDGVSGVLIGPNDADRLAEELGKLINDPERRKMLGSNAKSVAAKKFNEKITAELTLNLYEKVFCRESP